MRKIILIFTSILCFIISSNSFAELDTKYQAIDPAIGCYTRTDHMKVVDFALKKDYEAIQAMISHGKCIFVNKGQLLYSYADICIDSDRPTDLFSFRPKGSIEPALFSCYSVKAL
jgi:hypothetical protein